MYMIFEIHHVNPVHPVKNKPGGMQSGFPTF